MTSLPTFGVVFIGCCMLGCLRTTQAEPIVVTSLLVEPFLTRPITTTINGTTVVNYGGYIPDLLDELFKLAQLPPYIIKASSGRGFGQLSANGSWDGLIGEVLDGKADIAAAPLTETAGRAEVVDFSTPFMSFGPVIVLKRPESPIMSLEDRLKRLFSPLSQSVWMLSGMAWFITSVVLYVICHINPFEWRRLAKDRQASLREGESFSCLNTFWFTMSNIMWQGYTLSPRSMGARVVVAFWWLFVLIFVVMYIASMTNYLRLGPTEGVSGTYPNIQRVEDLGKQTDVLVGVMKGGTSEQYIKSAKDSQMIDVWTKIKQDKWDAPTLKKAIEKIRRARKPVALVTESGIADFFVKQSPCELYMVGDFTTIGSYSLAFRLNSSLVKPIDVAMLTLRETGVLKQLEDRWFSGECDGTLVDSNTSMMKLPPYYGVDLATFSGALIILALGLILGSLITVVEVVVFKYAEARDKKDREYNAVATSEKSKHAMPVSHLEPEPITDV